MSLSVCRRRRRLRRRWVSERGGGGKGQRGSGTARESSRGGGVGGWEGGGTTKSCRGGAVGEAGGELHRGAKRVDGGSRRRSELLSDYAETQQSCCRGRLRTD